MGRRVLVLGLVLVVGCGVTGPTRSPEPTNDRGETLEQKFARIDGDASEAAEFRSLLDKMMACRIHAPTREEQAFAFYYAWNSGGRQGRLIEFARAIWGRDGAGLLVGPF